MSSISYHLYLFTDSGKRFFLGSYTHRTNLDEDIQEIIDDFKEHGYTITVIDGDHIIFTKEIPIDVAVDEVRFELNVVPVIHVE